MVAGTIWLNTLFLNLKGIIVSIKILAFNKIYKSRLAFSSSVDPTFSDLINKQYRILSDRNCTIGDWTLLIFRLEIFSEKFEPLTVSELFSSFSLMGASIQPNGLK